VQDVFPLDVDRVLYLDGDIVIAGDIEPLWNTDLEGALIGAVDILGSRQRVVRLDMTLRPVISTLAS
jgi:lipopolysaccharide biosynthesis glycosyltransferase